MFAVYKVKFNFLFKKVPIHTEQQRQRWRFGRNTLISIDMSQQTDTDADAWKWLPDPFQESTLLLPLTLALGMNAALVLHFTSQRI